MLRKIFTFGFLLLSLFSCADKTNKVSIERFVGLWEVRGRTMFEGIQIKITRENGKLVGKIVKLNNNKVVKMFADTADVWVSDIKQTSNYQFVVTEKKIAKDLFSLYGQPTSLEYKAQFIDENTIGLAIDAADPLTSKVIYKKLIDKPNMVF